MDDWMHERMDACMHTGRKGGREGGREEGRKEGVNE